MKKILSLLFCIVLTSCGFVPMYSGQTTDVYVAPISGINGIELRNALWAEFGNQYGTDATYTLMHNNKTIASGSEHAAESYPFVSYLVASNASYNNAVKNIIRTLSEQISSRVIAETYKFEHKDK